MSDESCFITDTAVRHGVKNVFISDQRLKTQKHSVSAGVFCSGFPFYEHFNRQFSEASLYIQNRKMCLSKKISYQYFVVFYLARDRFSTENILYVIAQHYAKSVKEKATKSHLKTTEVLLDADGHELT